VVHPPAPKKRLVWIYTHEYPNFNPRFSWECKGRWLETIHPYLLLSKFEIEKKGVGVTPFLHFPQIPPPSTKQEMANLSLARARQPIWMVRDFESMCNVMWMNRKLVIEPIHNGWDPFLDCKRKEKIWIWVHWVACEYKKALKHGDNSFNCVSMMIFAFLILWWCKWCIKYCFERQGFKFAWLHDPNKRVTYLLVFALRRLDNDVSK